MTVASKTTYLKGVFVFYKLLFARRFQERPKHHTASPLRGYAASGRASTTVGDDVGSPGVVAFFFANPFLSSAEGTVSSTSPGGSTSRFLSSSLMFPKHSVALLLGYNTNIALF